MLGLDDDASKLAIGWLVGCFMPEGPYPILVLSGEQGSGKTTLTRMCRRLVDPNASPVVAVIVGIAQVEVLDQKAIAAWINLDKGSRNTSRA